MKRKGSGDKPIVYFGGEDNENVYCASCDYLLIPLNDVQLVCSGCERMYDTRSVLKHRKALNPVEGKMDIGTPEVVPMSGYTDKRRTRKYTFVDADDIAMRKPGRTILSEETYWPEGEEDDE
jgi:hypothetical protein